MKRISWLLGCAAVLGVLAVGCSKPPVVAAAPVSMSFRPTSSGAALWLATAIAVEVKTERDARLLEAEEPMYVGELGIRGEHIRPEDFAIAALVAAEHGATHFRVVCGGTDGDVDVVLYRLEPERWSWLPESLRPTSL